MANQVTNYKCPACTGPLRFDSATGKLQCDFCGSSYEVAEIENSNSGCSLSRWPTTVLLPAPEGAENMMTLPDIIIRICCKNS